MRQLCLLGVVFTILLAGGVYSEIIREIVINEGNSFSVSVTTLMHNVDTCHLKPPHNEIFSFVPRDESQTTDKYVITQGSSSAECALTINNFDKNDEGIWVLTYDHEDGEGRVQNYNITVISAEPEESIETEDEDGTLLSVITHFTRENMLIDISLNKQSYEEECYVRPPNGVLTKVELLQMEGVTIQSSSDYVSCRITIGPMSEEFLGEWRLCGNTTEHDMRCQPATVEWNNNNAIANWGSIVYPRVSHPFHFGGSVNPGITGNGDAITCHVMTPAGEDLVIKDDVKYPHIERITSSSLSLCSIRFTDIDRSMIGDWTIYGKFRAFLSGLNEARLPLNFFLYNEANPYEQAYNVTVLPEDRYLVNLGTSMDVEVRSFGKVDDCLFKMPSGLIFDLKIATTPEGVVFKDSNIEPVCGISIDPITEETVGEWQLIGKFSNGNLFSERRQIFHIIKEDPANPIIEDHREVEDLTELILDSHMGASHRVTINAQSFVNNEGCHLLTPDGLQYAFIPGFYVPHVEIIQENGVECGVRVNVESLDMLGEWTLIARSNRLSTPIERRLPFIIRVEETISLGNPINITEGADLYLRLLNATEFYETCKLYGSDGVEVTDFEVDSEHSNSCGYIIRDVNQDQHGTWTIVYGNRITYRASVDVNVLGSHEVTIPDFVWTLGSFVNTTIGPEDAAYCKLEDASGYTVFDGFGPCKILLERVTSDLTGYWTVFIGFPGTVFLQKQTFYLEVQEADSSLVITTNVVSNVDSTSVLMTCSVPASYEIQGCKFRNPQGDILLASHGVGQDGIIFETATVTYESAIHSHDCTLRLTHFTDRDLGLWRCAVDTTQDTYFGFVNVIFPWLLDTEPVAASAASEPLLKPTRDLIDRLEDEPVEMSCSVNSAIRYCYFRNSNGTVYNVGPTTSSPDYEYVGSGFDAGDCGVRFRSLPASSSGFWSCHVGHFDTNHGEQRAYFQVKIAERLSVTHFWENNVVKVRGVVYESSPLDYCRFVRFDGFGFTSEYVPPGYVVGTGLNTGVCALDIAYPSFLDLMPWTVAAKLSGHHGEVSKSTLRTLPLFPGYFGGMSLLSAIFLLIFVTTLGILLICAGVALIPKKNREWTYARASHIRNSFRKQPLPIDVVNYPSQKV